MDLIRWIYKNKSRIVMRSIKARLMFDIEEAQ